MKMMQQYIGIAKAVSELSKDRTKIGCIALSEDNRIIGAGCNGYPKGYNDSDLSNKYEKVIHAEVNAVINSSCGRDEIHTLVLYGLPPCKDCMKFLAAYGIKRVYYYIDCDIESAPFWNDSHHQHKSLHKDIHFEEVKICN